MNIILLGAGASKSYADSLTKVKMPIAKDFFKTFNSLRISEERWVLVGDILNYLKAFHHIPYTGFIDYNQDIEVLHSEVANKLNLILEKGENIFSSNENILIYKTYIQLIFVFTSVINEIQNGPPSISHINLANQLTNEDVILTFNWDTLMDRALEQTTEWNTDSGYFIKPTMIYKNEWKKSKEFDSKKFPTILKLHGSSNWLTSYLRPDGKELKSLQETPTNDFYVYESTINPYSTYNGRYMSGYSDYSYGYYPPNLPLRGEKIPDGYLLVKGTLTFEGMPKATSSSDGLVSMPLIIPPVKHKNYSHFGDIFSQIWNKAEESLVKAEKIIIIGYSFPPTDIQTDILFKKAFIKRSSMPEVIIVDPHPENICNRFIFDYGIKQENITVYKNYFNQNFDIKKLYGLDGQNKTAGNK